MQELLSWLKKLNGEQPMLIHHLGRHRLLPTAVQCPNQQQALRNAPWRSKYCRRPERIATDEAI
jgi:hypothetical protein